MKVYRLQNKDGCGPYQVPHGYRNKLLESHNVVETHPVPEVEGLQEYGTEFGDWLCAFYSLEALECWFGGWLAKLTGTDFSVIIHDVPIQTIRIGQKQLIFKRSVL